MTTFAFVDAANLFYGGEKSLGWKIDYEKLHAYLCQKYQVSRVLYFGGVEIHDFPYDYLTHETVPVGEVERHLRAIVTNVAPRLNEADLALISRHLQRIRFYLKLGHFGFELLLKPVKLYEQDDGTTRRKANCDVDMAFALMREQDQFDRVIILSGDGDFLPILKYLRKKGKDVIILARGPRTAREIRQFAGAHFRDFIRLEKYIRLW